MIRRTASTAMVVTLICAAIAFPPGLLHGALCGATGESGVYVAVMLPLWSNYLVRVYAWKLILAKEGALTWVLSHLGLQGPLDWVLATPDIGGASLGTSMIGTTIVFVYIWLPYMVLPIQARWNACRVPDRGLERSRRASARDLPPRDPAAVDPRRRRGLDLHLLPDPRRLHHPEPGRLVAALHRPAGLSVPGHRLEPAAGCMPSRSCRSSSWRSIYPPPNGSGLSMRSDKGKAKAATPKAGWGLTAAARGSAFSS